MDIGSSLAEMKSMQAQALQTQTEINKQSMMFNTAMAAKDAEKKAWEKISG
ncbi:hypothetical protein [Paracoccus laeviglucosivorans]|uniref:Uncharacterized protein n=1 Tax=Paracoccus laeviglucosivorans TaxID=1197861 RepID=A0A521BDH6_9RHOB|nr:hypothetical protein [Paracoccus laeviglucosivorans]SMO45144.1 hypothetical protein SAMN06265221_102248 [Paracoccus laeviglucosivorans]